MQTKTLSAETTNTILESAWQLILDRQRIDVSLVEIARAAGVSRQSIYLAFGSRSGLLIAMARQVDGGSPHSKAMAEIASREHVTVATLEEFVRAWLRHLPIIFPVGVLLGAAAVTDPEAETAFRDRMVGSLHAKYSSILTGLSAAGRLRTDWTVADAADFCWSLTHISAWRELVVEREWTAERFVENRLEVIHRTLLL